MKKNLKIVLILVLGASVMWSCTKKNDPEPFSEKSVEENKEVVENSALTIAESMDDMKDLSSFEVLVSLGYCLDYDDPFYEDDYYKKSKVTGTLKVLTGVQDGKYGVHEVFSVMRAPYELNEDPETIQEFWDEVVGVYTWNSEKDAWFKTQASDEVVFLFPSVEGGTVNDAELTISNYQGVIISNPIDSEYDGDLPVSLSMQLKLGSDVLVSHTFSASYTDGGTPEMIAADLTIENFTFEVDFTNNDQEISASSQLTHDGKTLIKATGALNGDFSEGNIEDHSITETSYWTDYQWDEQLQDWVEVQMVDEWTELVDPEGVFFSTNAVLQVSDIALKGNMNIAQMIIDDEEIYPRNRWDDPNWDEEDADTEFAAAINKNMDLYAVDLIAETKIAEVEAYVVKEYDDYYGDYNTWVDFRLVFGDESPIDLETYFEDGFHDFIGEVNSMIFELNSKYDWDIDPIDY